MEKKKEKTMHQGVPSGLGPVRGPALTHLLTKAHGTIAEVREALAEIEEMAGEKVVAELERHAAELRELRRALEHFAAQTDERFQQHGKDLQALRDSVADLAGHIAGVDATLARHAVQLAELKAACEGLDRRLDSLQQQIRDLAASTNQKFEALQQQIRDLAVSMSRRMDSLENRMTILLLAVVAAALTVPGPAPGDAPASRAARRDPSRGVSIPRELAGEAGGLLAIPAPTGACDAVRRGTRSGSQRHPI